MSLVPSLLQAIVGVDGEALVMHAGDKPYVVAPSGQIELASRGLTLEAVKLAAVVVDAEHHSSILEIATERQPEAAAAQAADLILHQKEKWHGYSLLGHAAAGAGPASAD